MTKLEMEAIRKLPDELVKDGACICLFENKVVYAAPNSPAMLYDGEWKQMELKQE